MANLDLTGHCDGGNHVRCQEHEGRLICGTGFHWWCICKCHPEPDLDSTVGPRADAERALEIWRKARAPHRPSEGS